MELMKIHINELVFDCIIGVHRHERTSEQRVSIDTEIEYKYTGEYLCYSEISNFIEKNIKEEKYKTIEEALIKVNKLLKLKYKNITKIFIKLTKPDAGENRIYSVSLIN